MNRPLTAKVERVCTVVMKSLLAVCALVVLLGVILFSLSPQVHWMVFAAQGLPGPPKDYTGTWRTWLPNGTMVAKEEYVNGKLNGPLTHWDSRGRMQLEASYRAGMVNGAWTSFHENASVRERSEYAAGTPTGHRIKFYQNGTTNFEVFHSRPGARDGPEISYTEAGERRVLKVWQDGRPWDGRFWSVSNGNSILRIYDAGLFISETNLGPAEPPSFRGGRVRPLNTSAP